MNIILFEKQPKAGLIPVEDERAKHILNVLKLKTGDNFRMGIVNESEGIATVKDISLDGIHIDYEKKCVPTLCPITLLCAQVRPICMKRILREAVSLGVGKIILTGSDTGEKSYLSSNLYKSGEYKEYLLDGAMQSSHAGVPNVVFAKSVDDALDVLNLSSYEEDAKIAGKTKLKSNSSVQSCDKKTSLIMLDNVVGATPLSHAKIEESAVLAIGPERGWSVRERELFINAGFSPMLLGLRVLRTETACSAGIAVLMSRMGFL